MVRVCILGMTGGDSQIKLLSWLYKKNDVEEITFVKNKIQFMKLAETDPRDVAFIRLSGAQPVELSILETLQKSTENMEVVFVSDIDDYALDAYKMGASGYLLEPIEKIRLERCFSKLVHSKKAIKGNGRTE